MLGEPPTATSARCEKILVIRGGAIGDFILTLPVLSALRAHYPEAGLELLGYPHIAQLALEGGLVDAVRPIEARDLAAAFAPDAVLSDDLADYFSDFDLIVSYLYDPGQIFQENIASVSPARFIAGPHRPDPFADKHATEIFLQPLAEIGVPRSDPTPRLNLRRAQTAPPRADMPPAEAHPARPNRLAIHPGSGSERKNWPESCWADLMLRLASRVDWDLVLVGGEAEGERLERLALCWPAERLEIARSLPLVELARRLADCRFYIGHDSGITHLAAALGLPGLVLWGESAIRVWRPCQEAMRCLHAGMRLAELEVEEVWAALTAHL